MRQIAFGILLTASFAASASAQTLTGATLDSALRGVKFTAPALAAAATLAPQAPAAAKKVTVLVGADVPSMSYYFRGLRQEGDAKLTFQPFVDVGVAGESASFNFGIWNSFHTGSLKDAGYGYYETDLYAAVTVGMFKTTYTAYTYPKIDASAVQEIMFSTTFTGALAPSIALAIELDKSSGFDKGIYLELGIAPAVPMGDDAKFSLTIPVKVGIGADEDYYFGDRLGYLSFGALIGVPVNDVSEVHFGVTGFAFPGDNVRFYNGQKGAAVVSGGFSVKF